MPGIEDDIGLICERCGHWWHPNVIVVDIKCPNCHELLMREKGTMRYEFMKKYHGFKPESGKRRARKSWNHQYVRIFFEDPFRFKRLFAKLKERDSRRASLVMRKIKLVQKYKRERLRETAERLGL